MNKEATMKASWMRLAVVRYIKSECSSDLREEGLAFQAGTADGEAGRLARPS